MDIPKENPFEKLTEEQKRRLLYENQKQTLELFVKRRAITKAQYEKSLDDLTVKMGYGK
ncbi:MAG: hypothetical protein K5647_05210 [Clostridiales bacterium]|nr:hypothetical protein [Clostridiales bacterium]